MLANPTNTQRELMRFANRDDWSFEQKVDGERRLILVDDGQVSVFGRDGQPMALPREMVAAFAGLAGRWIFDGELIGGVLWLFDIVEAPGRITFATEWWKRRELLDTLACAGRLPGGIRVLPCAWGTEAKLELATRLLHNRAEGIIARQRHAPYEPGVRSKRCVKLKFTQDVDCVVLGFGKDGHDNIVVGCHDAAGTLVYIGEVTAQAGDGPTIKMLGALRALAVAAGHAPEPIVICVKYLYTSNDRKLIQPTLPRLRTDKGAHECGVDQLKYVNKEVHA